MDEEQSKQIIDAMHADFCKELQELILQHSAKWSTAIPCDVCRYRIMEIGIQAIAVTMASITKDHVADETMH